MNTLQTRQAALVATLIISGTAFLAGDLHRIIIAWAWPFLTWAYDYYIAF